MKLRVNIGKLNRVEKIYIFLFILSIITGVVNGVLNKTYFQDYESSLDLSPGETGLTIFFKNFILSAVNLVTAGLSNFYFVFITFSISASYLYSQGILLALPLLFIHGSFELIGTMFFGLIGLNFFERKILKFKSRLKIKKLLIYGLILLAIGATIEYFLWLLI